MEQIAEKLEDINKTLKKMLDIMPKPAGKIQQVLEMMVLFVGLFGIIALVDIVRNWFFGG